MIPNHLSATWTALPPALGNHLWQSTLFAIMAGLLTLMLRKNQARVRYWLWLAASVRFLIPFSSLVGIGSYLPWSHHAAGTKAGFYIAMEEVSQPFTQPTMPMVPRGIASAGLTHPLPAILAAVWLCGFLVVIFQWYFRWRRISTAIRKSVPLEDGREVQALRRLERIGGMRKGTEMLLSRTSLEPGIFGIIRPVLVWPEGISERLEDAHLEVILAHELCHVRRRDNLAATLHMVVEAIFWFHPLVWWLEARMMEERERACDEEVLESGSDRQVYAESILKICEFCVGSPLACVSGVTGADLKKRIARIMTGGFVRKLDFSRKLLLSAVALAAIALPILFGPLQATPARAESQAQSGAAFTPAFEIASIKPNNGTPMAGFSIVGKPFAGIMWKADRFMATNFTLHKLIQRAYDVQDDQVLGGPDWLNSEGYDIDAKVEKSEVDELQRLGPDQRVLQSRRMLQEFLADRFKLSFHSETKEVLVYALVIAEKGLKIQRAIPGDTYPNGFKRTDGVPLGTGDWSQPGKFVGQGVPIAPLVQDLSEHYLHRTILDKTGLTDKYDFTLQWTPVESEAAIFTAIQEQLGLKLEPQKGPMQILIIDHAEKPAESLAQNPAAISPVSEAVSRKPNKSDNPRVGINLQPQNTAAVLPVFDTVSIRPHISGDELFKMMVSD
jgi:bla regulator protein BlaR1